MILRRFDPLSCSLKKVHANIFMLACSLFNEQDKGSNLLSIVTWSVLGKQNVQAKKVYYRGPAAGGHLSPPQRFKHSLYQSAVRSVPQAQSRMDRSGGEPLPDVCRFLVHPCRFLVHRWISRLWLHLTA